MCVCVIEIEKEKERDCKLVYRIFDFGAVWSMYFNHRVFVECECIRVCDSCD